MSIDWTIDEIILACDLVCSNGWKAMNPNNEGVLELSLLLNKCSIHPLAQRDVKFRNPNGVARKTSDIATQHPDYKGKATKGGKLDRSVLRDFLDNPVIMQAAAAEIRDLISKGETYALNSADNNYDDDEGASEGRLLMSRHLRRERNPKLRRKKIESYKNRGLPIECEVCNFNFFAKYGIRGADYIEVHHVLPLHASGEVQTKLNDLAMLCSNCHRMIHRGKQWLTPSSLSELVLKNNS